MATGVVFGQPRSLILQPGAYSMVDASALNLPQAFAYNIVVVLGAALGGTPLLPYYLNDPIQATQVFGAGTPLADGIRFAFQGGANGGAPVVIGVRVDNTSAAAGSLTPPLGASVAATFDDYGGYGNTYSLAFYPGSIQGTMAVVQGKTLDGKSYYRKIDNEPSFSTLIQRINANTPVTARITAGGVRSSQTITIAASQTDGRATLTDAQGVVQSNQAYAYQYPSSLLPNIKDSMAVSFLADLAWTVASITPASNLFTTAANTLVDGHIVNFKGTLPTGIELAKSYVIREATATTFKVAELLNITSSWAVSALATNTFTATGNTLADGDVVRFTGTTLPTGIVANRAYFVRDKAANDFKVAATMGGLALTLTGSIANLSVTKIAGGVVTIAGTIGADTKVIKALGTSTVSNSIPSDFNGFRTPAKVLETYTQTVANLNVTAAAYTSDSARFTLAPGESWGSITGRGVPGQIFTIASGVFTGTYQILHYEYDGYGQDRVRVCQKLTGDRLVGRGSYSGTLVFYNSVLFGRSQPATDALATQIPSGGILTRGGQYITLSINDQTIYYSTMPGDTIDTVSLQLVNAINAAPDTMPVVASYVYNPATFTAVISITADDPGTLGNLIRLDALINTQTLVLMTTGGQMLAGGIDPSPPQDSSGQTAGAVIFSGGYDSYPTYQRWLDGLEAVKYISCRWLVPMTDNVGVQMALADHCALMSTTPKRRERMAVMGHGLDWTRAAVRARSESFNSERVVFVSPGFQSNDNLTGNLRMFPSFYSAAVVAGMLAAEGNGISDPITHTYMVNATRLEMDYKPGSVELDEMIESGVLTLERDPGLTRVSRGFRVTRALTTFRVSSNSAYKSNSYESISILNQSDYVASRVREMEEDLFIGTAIFPDTLEQIRTAVNREILRQVRDRVIYGYDQKFTKVALNPDSRNAVNVTYKIYPAPALEFILNTQLLFPIPEEESVALGAGANRN
jgi:hypothetical protein